MIAAADVSAVLVTRGDVDLAPIIESLAGFGEIVVWDNSGSPMPPRWWHAMPYPRPHVTWCGRHDLAVYGRYAAIESCTRDVIYVQDDDVLPEPESLRALLAAYEPGILVANMPSRFRHDFYADHCLVGFGAIFDRDLSSPCFERLRPKHIDQILDWPLISDGICATIDEDPYVRVAKLNPWFARTCDVAFTAFTPRKLLDLPYTDREFASAPNRMWKQPEHLSERTRMLELVTQVRDA